MERIIQMLGILAVLYAAYALSLKKWTYVTEARRQQRRRELKEKGLSNMFYFIGARTLFLLNAASGGLFSFYWIYRQWQAAGRGFKRLDGKPLKGGPLVRTLGGLITFFPLNALIARTCEYMHKKAPLPPWVWGTLWLGGLAGAVFVTHWPERLICYAFFCGAPAALQNRLNALPKDPVPAKPKPAEIIAAAGGLILTLGIITAWRVLAH